MTWQEFTEVYADTGTIRLGSLSITPAPADMIECRATMAFADRIMSMSATATGPVGAMTSILHDLGAPVSIVSLHQRPTDRGFAAFLLCERDDRQCWAYGDGATGDEANVNALIAGANRLLPR
ncbi:hypothetical protein [Gordonia polyisoprenivorans]|uniref:hypothetical protein n=1 Tax=Gordonia polyisoprenivorans TaxID=84595 RepID=UPI0022349CB0|nr:hypothetical protein [Gordonia polyisoprenivorans]UZF57024.1 hypothetical protein LH935_03220 [Gordonia polyisoprenivorans]WCB38101.1 hypothetical protein PHA63_02795 [Gordonia polyisoprenivorans]